jgi:hypothetical protein
VDQFANSSVRMGIKRLWLDGFPSMFDRTSVNVSTLFIESGVLAVSMTALWKTVRDNETVDNLVVWIETVLMLLVQQSQVETVMPAYRVQSQYLPTNH